MKTSKPSLKIINVRDALKLLFLLVTLILQACINKDDNAKRLKKKPISLSDTIYYESDNNHIILNSIIERKPTKLIFDTGAPNFLYLDSAFTVKNNWFKPIDSILLGEVKPLSLGAYSDERNKFYAKKISFSLGNIKDSLLKTNVTNLYKVIKGKADGIIGNDFMARFVVEIDYDKKYIILHSPKGFQLQKNYDTLQMEYKPDNKFIWLKITYHLANGKHFTETSHFDLGVGRDYLVIANNFLINEFDLKNNLANRVEGEKVTTVFGTNLSSVIGNIESIVIGNSLKIDTPKIGLLIDDNPKRKNSSGYMLTGNYIFKRFGKIFIDYQNSQIYIPNQKTK